jgi:hypothetical protein
MEYQKRLKFIDFIKKKFIDSNPNCKRFKGFYFKNYEDLESIEMRYFESADSSSAYYEKLRYEKLGACVFVLDYAGIPYLIFEDAYMVYMINLTDNKCDHNVLNEILRSDKKSLKVELQAFIRQLNGEDPPETIYNC